MEQPTTAVNMFENSPNLLQRIGMEIPILGAAAKQAWAEQREDTAIQRQMADMKKAGINPILAYSGGAGAPTSAASNAVSSNNTTMSTIANIANSAYSNKTKKEIASENNKLTIALSQISNAIELLKLFG